MISYFGKCMDLETLHQSFSLSLYPNLLYVLTLFEQFYFLFVIINQHAVCMFVSGGVDTGDPHARQVFYQSYIPSFKHTF